MAIWYTWQDEAARVEIQLLDGPPASRHQRRNGRQCSYVVPDFLVEMTDDRKRLVEVKPSDRLSRPKVRRKLAVAEQFAAQTARRWREGLAAWDQTPQRIAQYRDAVDRAIYTPGSNAGLPISVLRNFAAPPPVVSVSRRIGVKKGAELPWRFFDPESESVSR